MTDSSAERVPTSPATMSAAATPPAAVVSASSPTAADVASVRQQLLLSWLGAREHGADDAHDSALDCAVYMMKRPVHATLSNAAFLAGFALTQPPVSASYRARGCALRVLLAAVPMAEAERATGRPAAALQSDLARLLYLSRFEALRIPHNLSRFASCSKEALVRGLWRDHANEPAVLRLIADLSIDYGVHDAQLWSNVLPQLLADRTSLLQAPRYLAAIANTPALCTGMRRLPELWLSVACGIAELSDQQASYAACVVDLLRRYPLLPHPDWRGVIERLLARGHLSPGAVDVALMAVGSDGFDAVLDDLLQHHRMDHVALLDHIDRYCGPGRDQVRHPCGTVPSRRAAHHQLAATSIIVTTTTVTAAFSLNRRRGRLWRHPSRMRRAGGESSSRCLARSFGAAFSTPLIVAACTNGCSERRTWTRLRDI